MQPCDSKPTFTLIISLAISLAISRLQHTQCSYYCSKSLRRVERILVRSSTRLLEGCTVDRLYRRRLLRGIRARQGLVVATTVAADVQMLATRVRTTVTVPQAANLCRWADWSARLPLLTSQGQHSCFYRLDSSGHLRIRISPLLTLSR